jgi:hypothetical protein
MPNSDALFDAAFTRLSDPELSQPPSSYLRAAGKMAKDFGQSVLDAVRLPGQVAGGEFAVKPETPGMWSEEDEYRQQRAGNVIESRAKDLGGTLMMGGISGAQKGAAGIFGGRLAATADQAALRKAEEMAGKGMSREQIWNETGWFQGADKKWRFEIPDDKSRFTMQATKGFKSADVGASAHNGTLGTTIAHPPLYEAYPDLGSIPVAVERGGGYPYQPSASYTTAKNGERIDLNTSNLSVGRPLALHEVQHAIQEREGFALGGDPRQFARENRSIVRDANEQIEAINQSLKAAAGTPRYNELLEMRSELARTVRDIEGPDGIGVLEKASQRYMALPGEVEARNVEARMSMTAGDRKATPPWQTQDDFGSKMASELQAILAP